MIIETQSTYELKTYLISGMFKISQIFQTLTAAEPLATEGTNGYKMKDMKIMFPLMRHGLL